MNFFNKEQKYLIKIYNAAQRNLKSNITHYQ
jgi:hypothetical protein